MLALVKSETKRPMSKHTTPDMPKIVVAKQEDADDKRHEATRRTLTRRRRGADGIV